MTNEVKKYFLAPNWDCVPGDGRIAIGNIVEDPTDPVPPMLSLKAVSESNILKSHKKGVEWTRDKHKKQKFGLWTKFLAPILGVGTNAEVSHKSSMEELFKFKRMETEEVILGEKENEYVKEALKANNVKRYLTRNKYKKPVFLIVGIKWVKGPVVKRAVKSDGSVDFNFSVDATGQGVPVSLGPEASASSGGGESVHFKGSSDFVFAFRVRKISVTKDGDIDVDEHDQGALFGLDGDDEGYPEGVKLLPLEDTDAGTGEELMEDENVVLCTSV